MSKKATSIAEKYALEGLKKQVVKGLGVAVGDIARAYTMSGTVQGLNTISDILNRSAGELTVDKQGNYQLKSDEPLLKSIYKGVTASAIENYTEMLGERLNIGGNLMRMLPKIGLGRVSNAITKIGTQDWYKVCNNWLSRAGVNDFGGEVLEEEIGIVLNAALVGDNPLLNGNGGLLDLRTQKDILGGMLLSISSMRAGALAMYGVKKGVGSAFVKTLDMYDKMQLNQSDKGGQSIFGEGWTEIKDEIDNTPNDKVNSVIEKLAKEHPSKDEQSAIIDYAVKLLKTRGHNLGISMASDGENDEGAQEEVKDMPDLSQPNAEYLNKDDGMIHKASLYPDASDPTGTAKDVFIIKGNLVTNEDGSINKDASDKTIIYIDGNGERHIASPDKFAAAYPPISNNEVQQANEGGGNEEAQTTGNYNKGDEVNINVNGINYTAIIQDKDGFDNYNVYYEDENGMMHPAKFTADQLNDMNGKSTVSNGQQATSEQPADVQQQVEQPVAEQASQQEQETQQAQEEQKPAIPTDEKGNTLYHQVPVETTINDLYDGSLDDNEIRDFVDVNISEADKNLEKVSKKAPKIGTNKAEYLKKKQEWQKQVEDATRIRDYWNSVKDYIAKQTHTTPEEIKAAQEELSGEAAKREYQGMAENVQQDPISVASDFIRGAKITPESFKAETGYGTDEQRKFVGMIAKAEKGGKTIDRLAEELVSYDNAEFNGSLFGGDTSSAKDAILSALQGAGTRGELKQTNEAEEQAYVDARNAARDAQYMEQYGMTYEEYLAYEEQIMPTIWREYNNYDETAFNNMYAEEIEQLLKSRENDTTGEKPTDDRGNKVLPEQQVNQQPGSEGGTEQGTEIQAGLQSDNENAAAPDETQQAVTQNDSEKAIGERLWRYVDFLNNQYGYNFEHEETFAKWIAKKKNNIKWLKDKFPPNIVREVISTINDYIKLSTRPSISSKIANAEAETDTNPTEGQKEAGNYKQVTEIQAGVQSDNENAAAPDETQERIIQPVGINRFGNIYNWAKGQFQSAALFLNNLKSGYLRSVFYRDGIGDIDMVWGNDKAGLQHIIKKHIEEADDFSSVEEAMQIINDTISNGDITRQGSNISLDNNGYRVSIAQSEEGNWVLTAVDKTRSRAEKKRNKGNATIGDQSVSDMENGTLASPQLVSSESKDSEKSTITSSLDEKIAEEGNKVDTNPTEGQKEAGNYKKGHVRIDGYDVTIEQPKGSVRRGTDANGKKWEQKMNNTYGYIRGTEGVDGDHIDIFLSDNPTEGNVYVVDQVNPDGSFDEHKVMYGFNSVDEARAAYLSNYEEGWKGLGTITEVSKEEFKKWVNSSKRKTKPFSEYKSVNAIGAQNEEKTTDNINSVDEFMAEARYDYSDVPRPDDADIPKLKKLANKVLEKGRDKSDVENKYGYKEMSATFDGIYSSEKKLLDSYRDNGGTSWVDEEDKCVYRINYSPAKYIGKKDRVTVIKEYFPSKSSDKIKSEKPAMQKVNVEGLFNDLNKKGETKLSDNVEPVEEKPAEGKKTEYGANNKVVSKERNEELKKRMIKKLGQLNFGMDPELIEIGCEMTAYHLEAGARKFADYAKAMINDVGDVIRPYLKSLYNAARDYPDVVEAGLNVGMSTGDEVSKFDVTNFDKDIINPIETAQTVAKEQNIKKETNDVVSEGANTNEGTNDLYRESDTEEEINSIINNAKSDGTYMKAPNGKPTNLNERQWAQVRTKAFKDWFGDWENDPENASKVVDENGEPLIVYHGSRSKSRINVFEEVYEKGTFFSTSKNVGSIYSSNNPGNLYSTFINAKNPLILDNKGKDWNKIDAEDLIEAAEKMFNITKEEFLESLGEDRYMTTDGIVAAISRLFEENKSPYDGLILKNVIETNDNEIATDVVAIKSNQIKSATDNTGAFSPENNDIRYRFIGETGARNLDAAEEATTRLDNLSVAREMENAYNEKKARIEKLKDSKPVDVKYNGEYDLNRKPAKDWLKENVRGEYTNNDTGEKIGISKVGINEVTSHGSKDKAHLKSLIAIPQMIEQSIFIDEIPNTKDHDKYDSYKYYVCGLKIDNVDYIVKLVVGVKGDNKYYDHRLTEIEKGTLIDNLNGLSNSVAENQNANISYGKDTKLQSILQTNDRENARKIKLATGWERGADGKWRYETTDFEYHPKGDARRNDKYKESEWYKELHVLEEKLFNGETLTDGETKRFDELSARVNAIRDNDRNTERIYLDDYVEDNELFKAYPELKQTKIDFVDLPNEGYSAKYNEKENRITVNQAKSIDDKSAIAHEVQHAIQYIEGFAKGGNGTEIQQAIDQIESKISDILKSDEYKKAINDFGKEYNQKIDKEVENTYPNLDPERKQAIRMAMRDDALIEYKKKSPILQRLSNLESELNVLRYDSSYKSSYVYNNLSGEVEARNVEARINMTPEERRQSLASETEDVAREDQLFIYDNLGVSARQGTGALTDSELSNANDPTGKMLGEPSRTPAQQRAFAERERQRMADRAREVADILHLDNVEIVTDASTLQGRRAKAKGFYSRDNGKIVIVVPNHVDMADIEQTVLHEAVAHYGLRKLFGKNFDTFLYNVYNNASQEVREKITQLAAKHNWDFATATEEYLASLAEKTNFEDLNASWWDKIKSLFLKLLHSIGLKGFTGVSLSDNELRYILWRSYENLKNPGRYRSIIDEARDMSMQNDLKVGNYSVQNSRNNVAEKSDNVLYREAKEVEDEINNDWRNEYDKKLSKFSFKFTEAAQDAMRSVKILQDIIAKETSAPISDDENVYWRENRLSSVNKYEQEYYAENYFKPIVTAIANLVKYGARYNDKGKDIINSDNDILKYLIAKHGIERNNYFREREAMNARKPYENQIKELQKQVEKGEIKEEDANKKIAKLQEQADKAEMKKRVDVLHKDYSGLTELFQDKKDFDTLAASYVSDFEKKFDTEPLWNAINRATKGTLRKAFVDGLISKESYENTANMYEYYIPLRGWANDVASEAYNYKGSDNGSRKILQTAKGRTSLADNPISEIGRMMQDAIFQGNRNRMKQAVYNLAMNHDTSLLNIKRQWYQNMGTKDNPIWERVFPDLNSDMTAEQVAEEVEDFESRMRELKKEGKATQNRKGLILRLHTTKREEAQHRISVAINGKEYNIFVNGNPRAAQAINGELNDVDRYGSYISKINRFLSQVYTSINPEFVVTNYQRDAGFAASIVASTEPLSYQKEWAKNMTIYNPITTGVYLNSLIKKAKTGNINPNNKAERYMQEFLSNGGETGFTNMLSADDYKKQIKRDIKSINSVVSLPKAARAAAAFTERANTVFEDATRYATYVTSREQGRTIDRSIRDAKEISLNFNTRGADGLPGDGFIYRFFRGLRRWMIFVNPSIQGLNKAGMAFRNHPLRSSMMIAGLPTLLGYALPAIMQAVVGGGDGDDDDKNVVESYKDLPKWVRRTNIAIPIGGNNFVTIPLSYELRVSYGLGEMMWEYGEGMIDGKEMAAETLLQLSDLLPVSLFNGTLAQSISPTIARPFVDIIQNRNFYGKKIYNDSQFIEGYPEYMKAYAGTPKWLVKSTEVLNNVMPKFGADVSDKYTPGLIDLNPAMIDYLLSSYLGGLYNFPSKVYKTISMIWDEDMRDIQNVPILSRNWKNSQSGNPYNSGDRYKTYMKEYDLSKQRFNGYKKEAKNDVPEFLNSLKDLLNTPSGKRMMMIDAYKRGGLDKLNQRIRDIDAYDNERYEGEKDALTKKRDEVKEELINKLDSISDGTLDFVNGEWVRK